MAKSVTIYSTPTCIYCKAAKEFMNSHHVSYQEFDVASDLQRRKEMIDRSGQMGVPVIDIDGQIMVGFEETALAKALGI